MWGYLFLLYIGQTAVLLKFFFFAFIVFFLSSFVWSVFQLTFLLVTISEVQLLGISYLLVLLKCYGLSSYITEMTEVVGWNEESYAYKVHHLCKKQAIIGVAEWGRNGVWQSALQFFILLNQRTLMFIIPRS